MLSCYIYIYVSSWTNNLNGKEKLRTQCLSAILECGHPTKSHWLWTRSDMTEYGTFYAATAIWSWNVAQPTEWTLRPECTRVGRCWSPWIKDFLNAWSLCGKSWEVYAKWRYHWDRSESLPRRPHTSGKHRVCSSFLHRDPVSKNNRFWTLKLTKIYQNWLSVSVRHPTKCSGAYND